MAHTILGIDLGTESVKVAHLSAGFRKIQLLALYERALAPGPVVPPPAIAAAVTPAGEDAASATAPGEPPPVPSGPSLLDRQLDALAALVREHNLRPEVTAVALRDAVTLRLLTLPLADPKKLEQVLPYELEGLTLAELDEQIITHTVAQSGVLTESGPEGSRLLSATAPRLVVEELIDRLTALGLEPRLIGAEALAPAGLLVGTDLQLPLGWPLTSEPSTATPTAAEPGVGRPPLPVVVLDIGAESTQVCVAAPRRPDGPRGRSDAGLAATFARTMGRGGRQLTAVLARALKLPLAEAEAWKRAVGLLEHDPNGMGEPDPEQAAMRARVATVLRDALRPFLRDLRQTLASYATEYGEAPRALLLTGGGSLLPGLVAHLEEALELPVAPLRIARAPWLLREPAAIGGWPTDLGDPPALAGFTRGALALSLALATAETLPQVNFRKGELAYKTDYSFLRERAPHLMAAVLAVLLCAGLTTLASLRQLQRDNERLEKRLRAETTMLFGEARLDGQAVSTELRNVIQAARGGGPSVPTLSAFDLLDEISRAAPAGTLDILELNIRPKKTDIKATAGSAQYMDDLAAALAKIPCFKEVDKGKLLSTIRSGADGKPVELKQFTLTINTTCP